MSNDEQDVDVVSETEHFAVWRSEEEDDLLYHLELGGVTLHLTSEEWEELSLLVRSAP